MNSCSEIHVPHEIVNDDYVTIVEWHAAQGDMVTSGQTVVSIETSKMVIDVEADADGFLDIVQPIETEVAVGELIGRLLAEAGEAPASPAPVESKNEPAPETPANAPAGVKISKKAQALIDQYGINAAEFAGAGLVKEADVISFLEKRRAGEPETQADEKSTEREALSGGDGDEPVTASSRPRGLFADAKVSAGDRGQSLFVLGINYVFRTWLLGNLVRWAPRGVIMVLHRWRGIKMGKGCFIDPSAIVETAYAHNITMGDDVRVTAGAVIMTHIKAPHYLRETAIMPPVVKPVVLEDHSFIGVNSVVMPGVTVGKASVVASGAVVMQNVPPYTMVAGNPAKVIKRFPQPADEAATSTD